jgi:hypothetical protein
MIRVRKPSSRHSSIAAAFCVATTIATLSAQTATQATPPVGTNLTTLNGCVDADKTNRRNFTLDDEGALYALKGVNMRDFVGKRVTITGSPKTGLKIVGGLYPNANVAAQGGQDHTQAAIAAQAGPTANAQRPAIDFNVKSVRIVGACDGK